MKSPDDVVSVELTVRQIAVIKALFGELVPSTVSRGIYPTASTILPITPVPDFNITVSPHVTKSHEFNVKVEKLLKANGYVVTLLDKLKEVL